MDFSLLHRSVHSFLIQFQTNLRVFFFLLLLQSAGKVPLPPITVFFILYPGQGPLYSDLTFVSNMEELFTGLNSPKHLSEKLALNAQTGD